MALDLSVLENAFGTCSICEVKFVTGASDVIGCVSLSCLHTVCRRCAETCADTVCRICGLGRKSPSSCNSLLHQLLKSLTDNRPRVQPLCTNCTDNQPSEHACLDCGELLCATCIAAHSRVKLTKSHVVKQLALLSQIEARRFASKLSSNRVAICHSHNVPATFFCISCQLASCDDCLSAHQGHHIWNSVQLATEAKRTRESISNDVIPQLQSITLQYLRALLIEFDASINVAGEKLGKLCDEVDATVENYINQIRQRANAAKNDIKAVMESVIDGYRKQQDIVRSTNVLRRQIALALSLLDGTAKDNDVAYAVVGQQILSALNLCKNSVKNSASLMQRSVQLSFGDLQAAINDLVRIKVDGRLVVSPLQQLRVQQQEAASTSQQTQRHTLQSTPSAPCFSSTQKQQQMVVNNSAIQQKQDKKGRSQSEDSQLYSLQHLQQQQMQQQQQHNLELQQQNSSLYGRFSRPQQVISPFDEMQPHGATVPVRGQVIPGTQQILTIGQNQVFIPFTSRQQCAAAIIQRQGRSGPRQIRNQSSLRGSVANNSTVAQVSVNPTPCGKGSTSDATLDFMGLGPSPSVLQEALAQVGEFLGSAGVTSSSSVKCNSSFQLNASPSTAIVPQKQLTNQLSQNQSLNQFVSSPPNNWLSPQPVEPTFISGFASSSNFTGLASSVRSPQQIADNGLTTIKQSREELSTARVNEGAAAACYAVKYNSEVAAASNVQLSSSHGVKAVEEFTLSVNEQRELSAATGRNSDVPSRFSDICPSSSPVPPSFSVLGPPTSRLSAEPIVASTLNAVSEFNEATTKPDNTIQANHISFSSAVVSHETPELNCRLRDDLQMSDNESTRPPSTESSAGAGALENPPSIEKEMPPATAENVILPQQNDVLVTTEVASSLAVSETVTAKIVENETESISLMSAAIETADSRQHEMELQVNQDAEPEDNEEIPDLEFEVKCLVCRKQDAALMNCKQCRRSFHITCYVGLQQGHDSLPDDVCILCCNLQSFYSDYDDVWRNERKPANLLTTFERKVCEHILMKLRVATRNPWFDDPQKFGDSSVEKKKLPGFLGICDKLDLSLIRERRFAGINSIDELQEHLNSLFSASVREFMDKPLMHNGLISDASALAKLYKSLVARLRPTYEELIRVPSELLVEVEDEILILDTKTSKNEINKSLLINDTPRSAVKRKSEDNAQCDGVSPNKK